MPIAPDRWEKVAQLFDESLAVAPSDRAKYIAQRAGGDREVEREVTSLLLALDSADLLERPALSSLDGLPASLPTAERSRIGERIGAYEVVREVAHGGMGAIYEAVRADDQYRKRVAIKTIWRGADSDLIVRRFRQERQILAGLTHPNIAALLDGGLAANGEPYFVMEFVDGHPIDDYCATHGFDLRQRIALFRQVCAAVQYAHRNLVVHRDLKPNNILVTADGTVKLLDFGIAKLLPGDEVQDSTMTRAGLNPRTTAYASPEQVGGGRITTASDVYSLGVVLYELVAGKTPFTGDGITPRELERLICDEEPPRPSTTATQLAALEARSDPLPRRCPVPESELDDVVMMALRKEPERRYASVEQLSEDLRRYIAQLPVSARRDTLGYRTKKFVRRNHTMMLSAGVAVLTLALAMGGIVAQGKIATQERDRARASAALADRERVKAERVNTFLQNMLGAVDPSWYSTTERPGPQTTVGAIFDAAARRADTDLAAQPDVLADVLRTLGRANQALRRLDRAKPQLERALELHLKLQGPASTDVATDEHELAQLLNASGDFPGAERWLRQSLVHFGAAKDSVSDSYGRTLGDLGVVLASSGRPAEAEKYIRASAEHRRRLDSNSVANVVLMANLGMVLSLQGKLVDAEPVYRAALDGFHRFRPREYFEEGYALGNLAVDYINRGQPSDAVPLAREQIAHFSRLLGPNHPNVGYGWVNLARAHHATKHETEALDAARTAEAIFKGALPAGHPDLARTELIQGQILMSLGTLPEAERRLRNAVAIRRARLAQGSTVTADAEAALGSLLVRTHRIPDAEPLLTAAHAAYLRVFGSADPRTVNAARQLQVICESTSSATACATGDTSARRVPR